jgi:hypothetical protein
VLTGDYTHDGKRQRDFRRITSNSEVIPIRRVVAKSETCSGTECNAVSTAFIEGLPSESPASAQSPATKGKERCTVSRPEE